MSILLKEEIKEILLDELNRCEDSLQLVSAFCKESVIQYIDENLNNSVAKKRLLVRFTKADLLCGVTDFSLYDYCQKHGWEMYVRFDLHAKIFIFDSLRCIIGSSNLTNKGFLSEDGNFEVGTYDHLDNDDYEKINQLFFSSILMTQEIYEKMKEQLDSSKKDNHLADGSWSEDIMNIEPQNDILFAADLPPYGSLSSYQGQDILFLGLNKGWTKETMKAAFKKSKCYKWLERNLKENNNEMFFGSLTDRLHDCIVNDPKPYRKEVKIYLANMLSLIELLNIEAIHIDRPNYSQRIVYLGDSLPEGF